MSTPLALTSLALAGALAVAHAAGARPVPRPEPETTPTAPPPRLPGAYAGLRLVDRPSVEGAVISWVLPGPLDGEGITSPTLARPDVLVAVNGQRMSSKQFEAFLDKAAPGSTVVLTYRRALERGGAIPDEIRTEEALRTVEIVLDERDAWSGTLGRPAALTVSIDFDGAPLLDPSDPGNPLGAAIDALGQRERVERLLSFLATWPFFESDYHELPLVRAGFLEPFRLPEIAERVIAPTREVAVSPAIVMADLAGACLEASVRDPLDHGSYTVREPSHAAFAMDFLLNEPRLMVRDALAGLGFDDDDDDAREAFARQCVELLRVPGSTFLIQETPREHIEVIRRSMGVDFERIVAAMRHLNLDVRFDIDFDAVERDDLPEALAGAVEGTVISAEFIPDLGWVVLGDRGPNTYDMSRITAVIDPGGDDVYMWKGLRTGMCGIIDLEGNDRYIGSGEVGPAGAIMGLSFIDDRAGDDRYEGGLLTAGAAIFGAALLVDRGGNDVYVGSEWSMGAAMYGAAALVDLGGDDVYEGKFLCQGVGGPRGFGALVDATGRDLYRADGPQPSMYDTPGVHASFSQGIGFGFRQYAAGGIGLLSDLEGDDRYHAGEFAQGGAYYHALGVLHDGDGRDLYVANRYGQGFGVHQAFGALVDGGGDDTYWSMTAASQGAAWDLSAGLLLDRAGNDSYQADSLAQGAAANQAIAMLIDLEGDDRYAATGNAIQGQSGANTYHFIASNAFSYSILFDRAGRDWYSSGRPDGAITGTGAMDTADPKMSNVDGVVIDLDE